MIQEVSNDVSFYEALALVVEQARLKDPRLKVQREIIRRANARLIELRATEQDRFKKAVWEMLDFLSPSTLSSVLGGIDSCSYFKLCQIGWGLGLDDDTIEWLESLRKEEEPRNHSTTKQRIVIVKGGTKKSSAQDDIPDWVLKRPSRE